MGRRRSPESDLELLPVEEDEADRSDAPTGSVDAGASTRRRPAVVLAVLALVAFAALGAVAVHLNDDLSRTRRQLSELRKNQETSARARTSVPNIGASPFTPYLSSLHGHGLLAIASDGHLRVLDGARGVMRDLFRDARVERPAWSPSGQWLSYVVSGTQVWVARADETDAHEVGTVGAASADTVAWSPTTDELALVADSGVQLVTPDGQPPRTLGGAAGAGSAAWSPDGKLLAVAVAAPNAHQARVVDRSGALVRSLMEPANDRGTWRLAGWWPDGGGLLAWRVPDSASAAADGMDLITIALRGGEPTRLTTMLGYRSWLSWSPDGRRVAVVEGSGREASRNKRLVVCDVEAARCNTSMLSFDSGTVQLSPAWSPDNSEIAYVQADEQGAGGQVANGYGTWLQTAQLWTINVKFSTRQRLGTPAGLSWAQWSPDGQWLLAEAGNRLYSVQRGRTALVGGLLYQAEFPPGYYYGFYDPSGIVAWHPG